MATESNGAAGTVSPAIVSAATGSPAHRPAQIGRQVVEDVLLEIRSMGGRANRTAIHERLDESLHALQQLRQSPLTDPEHLKLLEASRVALKRGADAIEGLSLSDESILLCDRIVGVERTIGLAREAVIDAVIDVQPGLLGEEFQARAAETVPDAEPFALSEGEPRLHAFPRERLSAHVDVAPTDLMFDAIENGDVSNEVELTDEEQYRWDLAAISDEEDEDEPLRLDEIPAHKSLAILTRATDKVDPSLLPGIEGELGFLRRSVRDCLEEIGSCANLRRLSDRETYNVAAQRGFERRMCNALDTIIAMSTPFFMGAGKGARFPGLDVLAETVQWGRDSLTIDPTRSFARSFLLGSVAGADAVRAAILAMRQSHPLTYPEQVNALSLAPNAGISEALLELLNDDNVDVVRAALDGLYARRVPNLGVVAPMLEHNDDGVRIGAARMLALWSDRPAAIAMLTQLLEHDIDDDVSLVALESLVYLGAGLDVLRERLQEAIDVPGILRTDIQARFMQLIAVCGDVRDFELIMLLYTGQAGEATAAGFHGHRELIPMLLDPLGGLENMTVLTGIQERQEAAAALVRITGAELPRAGDAGPLYDVSIDGRAWGTWWKENQNKFSEGVRYRHGVPWTASSVVDELEGARMPLAIRKCLVGEIAALRGEAPIDVLQLSSRQDASIGAARASILALTDEGAPRVAAGQWPGRSPIVR